LIVDRYHDEHRAWVNTSAEAQDFLRKHKEHAKNYKRWEEWIREQAEKARQVIEG
jgi:hypothetical protein